MLNHLNSTKASLFISLQAFAFFIGGYILEYVYFYMPCVLCFIQRYIFLLVGIFLLVAACFRQRSLIASIHITLSLFTAVGGLSLAIYHAYIQTLPIEQVHNCKQSITTMLENLEFGKIIEAWLKGDEECYIVQKFLGINLTHWSIFLFTILILQIILGLFGKYKKR